MRRFMLLVVVLVLVAVFTHLTGITQYVQESLYGVPAGAQACPADMGDVNGCGTTTTTIHVDCDPTPCPTTTTTVAPTTTSTTVQAPMVEEYPVQSYIPAPVIVHNPSLTG